MHFDTMETRTYEEYLNSVCVNSCDLCNSIRTDQTKQDIPARSDDLDHSTFCKMHSRMYFLAKLNKSITTLAKSLEGCSFSE